MAHRSFTSVPVYLCTCLLFYFSLRLAYRHRIELQIDRQGLRGGSPNSNFPFGEIETRIGDGFYRRVIHIESEFITFADGSELIGFVGRLDGG